MLDRIPKSPPVIKPVSDNGDRPLWSVMIPTYNCSKFLKETLQSVLLQAKEYTEMQIAVIDDYSTDDDVEAIVNDIGKGRIEFFRQNQNVGSLRNFETCINRSKGKWIHILHGDDMVKPGFYSEIEDLFTKHPDVGAAFTSLSDIDEQGNVLTPFRIVQNNAGIVENWLLKIARNQFIQVCSIVVKRSVYEELGSFYAVHYGEDWEMWARIAARFPVAYSPKDLAFYRVHSNNISARYLSTGQNIRDIKTVINIIQNYLPVEKRKELKKVSSRNFANYFAENAHKIYRTHKNKKVALKQAQGALSLHLNKMTVKSLAALYIMILKNYYRRKIKVS
jgi:glycosyltransferase involved in cell wall biosynthesis